ncbi:MAG: bifunctional UDP-N-acetylglucosamine diphosphorylase/glucosamine-1-phosphate N-acetyltransferase GlmU, partial [Myxococcota bacterium]
DRAKVLQPLLGEPMLRYPLATAAALGPARTLAVVGYQADEIRARCGGGDVEFVLQEPQLGSGHAALVALKAMPDFAGNVLIVNCDGPLVRPGTLSALLEEHGRTGSAVTLLGMRLPDPTGYGRVLCGEKDGRVVAIREERDATAEEKRVNLVHSGAMIAAAATLRKALERIRPENDQGEYYLTDIVEIAVSDGLVVGAAEAADATELEGINTKAELARATARLRDRINEEHMAAGVTLLSPESAWIGPRVRIGADTTIGPGVEITGDTKIGQACTVETGAVIENAALGNAVHVKPHCVIRDSTVEDSVQIGPMAHLRPETVLRQGSKVGNFVEIKKSEVGRGSKVNHLSYIGDTTLGEKVNVGAGTITCNYDGEKKHRTVIEDGAFIGSNTQLVAPVTIGRGAYIGSGSTITKDVPPGALAVGRGKQRIVERWAEKRRKKG